MKEQWTIKRTDSKDPDFQKLISCLDHELWNEVKENQSLYDQYNKVPDIATVVVVYSQNEAVACGCFKRYREDTVELKRMYVLPAQRGKGIAAMVLNELETWAKESGYAFAVLETGKKLTAAQRLYQRNGYIVTDNYDQYIGLPESVCMKKSLRSMTFPSVFKDLRDIEYFDFEEDFVEANVRCIPMIVRFKMDAAGIKLKLAEWNKLTVDERIELAIRPCTTGEEAKQYSIYLSSIVKEHTHQEATALEIDKNPEWRILDRIPEQLKVKAWMNHYFISAGQWKNLTDLQRFALVKLCRPGHESRNFTRALKEFGFELSGMSVANSN